MGRSTATLLKKKNWQGRRVVGGAAKKCTPGASLYCDGPAPQLGFKFRLNTVTDERGKRVQSNSKSGSESGPKNSKSKGYFVRPSQVRALNESQTKFRFNHRHNVRQVFLVLSIVSRSSGLSHGKREFGEMTTPHS